VGRRLKAALGLGLVIGLLWAGYAYVEPRRRARQVQEALQAERRNAEACRMGLVTAEATFRDYDERIDSLRSRVGELEALHPDGVPADSFEVYLEAFDDYNRAVEEWDGRVEDLQEERSACVEIVERHNTLSDSLRGILEELGEIDRSTEPAEAEVIDSAPVETSPAEPGREGRP